MRIGISFRHLLEPPDGFETEVLDILSAPDGWTSYGHEFHRSESHDVADVVFVYASPQELVRRNARGFSLCDCSRGGQKRIFIHSGNWMTGGFSQMPLNEYRSYLISHEVGHALGMRHPPHDVVCRFYGGKFGRASVMMQMTRGPAFIAPFSMTSRPLPYPSEVTLQRMMRS